MADHNLLGQTGETEAAIYLTLKGYKLLDRNWRSSHLEIDIVAEWYGEIVFVEVKTRSSEDLTLAKDAVTPEKMRNIVQAGRDYIARHRLWNAPYSFDIITVVGTERPFEIKHYKNAYRESNVIETYRGQDDEFRV